MTPFASAL
ncbi:hypothetical protein N499_0336A, partial [Wolbachia pipientis wVitA]